MTSHYDAHGLGEPLSHRTQRDCRVRTSEEVEKLRDLIRDQNVEAALAALADGSELWVFRTSSEIQECIDLLPDEKAQCLVIFSNNNNTYAGWCRVRRVCPMNKDLMQRKPRGVDGGGGGGNWSH